MLLALALLVCLLPAASAAGGEVSKSGGDGEPVVIVPVGGGDKKGEPEDEEALIITDIPIAEPEDDETEYPITIDGTTVTSKNMSDVLGNGVFSFDGDHTLTINGDYTDENGGAVIRNSLSGLVVDVAGDSVLTGGTAITVFADTTIKGSGKLTANSGSDCGIYILNGASLTISNMTLEASGSWGIAGKPSGETLSIVNSTVIARGIDSSGHGGICDFNSITLSGCCVVEPEGGYIDGGAVMDADGNLAESVVIAPLNGSLSVTKAVTTEPANGKAYELGEEIGYEITVTNDGNLTITAIEVTDSLTDDKWAIGSLAPGAEQSFTTSYTVTEADILAGQIVNTAEAKGISADPEAPEVSAASDEVTVPAAFAEHTVTVTDYTKGAASCSLAEGVCSGVIDFTVSCEDDQAVLVAIRDGETLTVLPCTTEDGVHSFSFGVSGDLEIVLALKGDVNLDGKLTTKEGTMIKRAVVGTYEISDPLSLLLADVDGDGELETADGTMLARAVIGTFTIEW